MYKIPFQIVTFFVLLAMSSLVEAQEEKQAAPSTFQKDEVDLAVDKAIAYLLQAGEQAKRSSANEAAITHFTRGLALLETTMS